MDRLVLHQPGYAQPDPPGEDLLLVQQKGFEHEKEYLASLRLAGRSVTDMGGLREHLQTTVDAMRRGDEIIYQGFLARDEFAGYADFLVRADTPSDFGLWSYEPWDTKLARHPKPYFLIQLCCYAEMLEAIQGRRPARCRIVLGAMVAGEPQIKEFRTDDFYFYYRALKQSFLAQQRSFDPTCPPEINPFADLGHWDSYARATLEHRDDLALVAGLRSVQRRKLLDNGIRTAAELAEAADLRVPRLNQETLRRLQRQAQLQIVSRGREQPAYESLPPRPGETRAGLALLPAASEGDIYFDMEGFPLIDEGREYLFGACFEQDGKIGFRDWWAHSPVAERQALEGFVRWAIERWRRFPDLHIYHYNHYEVTALKRLKGRYGACEDEIDGMLRDKLFVDLYPIVRQSLLIGEPDYSLKSVEHLYRPRRTGGVATADQSMVFYQRWLVAPDGDTPATSDVLRQIRDYNEEDCRSTRELAAWLRSRQREAGILPWMPEESPAETNESGVETDLQRRRTLAEAIRRELPEEMPGGQAGDDCRVKELLSWLLEFHRREEQPVWWRRFRWQEMAEPDLIDDPECLAGLVRTAAPPRPMPKPKRSTLYEFQFDPHQETKLREGDPSRFAHDWTKTASIESLDPDRGFATLSIGSKREAPPDRLSLMPDELLLGKPLAAAIERLVERRRSGDPLPSALVDLLGRRRPRLAGIPAGPVLSPGSGVVDGALGAALAMQSTTLCVQGPPGCGKTYVGARVVAGLLRAGRRVGIASNSHKAVNLFLARSLEAAVDLGLSPSAAKVGSQEDQFQGLPENLERFTKGDELFATEPLPQLIGGTAFAFAGEKSRSRLDYLFVDEAGQVSLANLTAMAHCAGNIVLLGDQMQLGQPTQAVHPGESGLSVLDYYLHGHATVPADLGIFLASTWRLHPRLCSFISGAVYEDRLTSEPHTGERVLIRPLPDWLPRAAGLVYVPVEHEDCVYESEEEAERIFHLVQDLLRVSLSCPGGGARPLTCQDILVVAPYNMQVRRLEKRLPGVSVGTVDKFQGQEAPVVIFSMCSSEGDASPRGIEFLFSRNRLNVAISRAETLAVIVGSPALLHTKCSSIEQMRLVNVYCRAVQEGQAPRVAGMDG